MSDMNFLEKLLDGVDVEWKALGALEDAGVLKLGRGNVISKNDLSSFSGDYPVYSSSASGSGIFGRYGKFMFEDERITWSIDGGGRFFHRQAHRYSVTNVCGWLRVNDTTLLNTRFLFHVLSGAWETKVFDYIKKAHPSVIRDEYLVPILSIEIQAEIVRILDAFTSLTAELTAELTARKKQYNYYRDQLLRFENGEVEWKSLSEIAYFHNAKPHEKLVSPDGDVALLTAGFISTDGRSARYVKTDDVLTPALKNDVAMVMSDLPNGRALAKTFFIEENGRYAANQRVCLLRVKEPTQLAPKFLHYVMNRNRQLLSYDSGVDQTHLKKDWILGVTVPVPPLAEQNRIVAILDKFDALTNSITEGLPREIELRQKQYEYFRDLLLSFPKPEEAAA